MSDLIAPGQAPRSADTKNRLAYLSNFGAKRLSLFVFVVLTVLVFATFRDYGISWDEHVQDIYGRDLLLYYRSWFHDLSAFNYSNLRYYGGTFDLVAAVLNSFSQFGEYETRHLLGGIIGLVGMFGAYRLACLLEGERAALFVLLLLALTPVLYGHNFINPKDAPFAWVLIWTVYYACRAIGELPRPTLSTALGFGAALGLTVGTRVVGLIIFVFCLPAFLAYAAGRYRETGSIRRVGRDVGTFFLRLLPALPVAFLVTAFFWPWVVQAPQNLMTALKLFASFPWQGFVLWNGQIYLPDHLPRLYLPVLIGYQLPEGVLVGLLAIAVSGVSSLKTKGLGHLTDKRSLGYSVVVSAAAIPILYSVVLRPNDYDGLRHFLFVVPPLVMLAGIGIEKVYAWALRHGLRTAYGCATLLAAFIAGQIAIIANLHPDEYVYFNVLAGGVSGAAGRFDLDYWGISLAEATRNLSTYVAQETPKPLSQRPWNVFVCGDPFSAVPFFIEGSNLRYVGQQQDADFAVSIGMPVCDARSKGRRILEVKRGGAVLSYVTDLRNTVPP